MTLNELRWFTQRLLNSSSGSVKIHRDPVGGDLVVSLYSRASGCVVGRGKDAMETAIAVAKWARDNARREAVGR